VKWIQTLSKAIGYIEGNLTSDISIDDVASSVHSSSSHFQLIFHVVMGLTIGEYIRNRRLSLAAQDLLGPGCRIIDVAMRYQYDTQESFSKAFARFHGVPPSKLQIGQARLFHPLTINVSIEGGFELPWPLNSDMWNKEKLGDEFHLVDWDEVGMQAAKLSAAEKYKRIIDWARRARGKNPGVFDALTEWLLDDRQWTMDKLAENEQILMQGVLARFKDQNARLRMYLKELEESGVVNTAVFKALDDFDRELAGIRVDEGLHTAVAGMFADFATMQGHDVRVKIAGDKTDPKGIHTALGLGYINHLKNCDAQVQWCLFMPDVVRHQQKGFQLESLVYKQMPALRFIGRESDDSTDSILGRRAIFQVLDAMVGYQSGFDFDLLFMHHYGRGVDVEPWHGFIGRFMKAGTPVPDGFVHWDLVEEEGDTTALTFRSQFAFAIFSGDTDAMHKREGYDSDAMYDVTRNIILGQGVIIPYPDAYWTAEVFLDGYDKPGSAYMFSVVLD